MGDSYGGNAAGESDSGTPILGYNNNEDAVIVEIISDNIGCCRPDIDAGICNLSGRPSPPCFWINNNNTSRNVVTTIIMTATTKDLYCISFPFELLG